MAPLGDNSILLVLIQSGHYLWKHSIHEPPSHSTTENLPEQKDHGRAEESSSLRSQRVSEDESSESFFDCDVYTVMKPTTH